MTEDSGTEVSSTVIWDSFVQEYLPPAPSVKLLSHELASDSASGRTTISAQILIGDDHRTIAGEGNGPIDAFVRAVNQGLGAQIDVVDYAEHAMGQGSQATAVAYVETTDGDGNVRWGVGTDPNIISASFRAVLNAYERHLV
ncbi:unannotated protein [freshwater metagenome]|uniref:Unannotated protein n=1 Tax=freshwater metagenome TaxID=449393 RepID=A0A6J6LVW2_9ZZZZ